MFCFVHAPKLHNDNDLCDACGTPYRVMWPKMWTEESARQDSLSSGETDPPHSQPLGISFMGAPATWGWQGNPIGEETFEGSLKGPIDFTWGNSKQRDQNVQMRKQKIFQISGLSIFLQKHKNCLFRLGSDKVQKFLWDIFSVTTFKTSFILQ